MMARGALTGAGSPWELPSAPVLPGVQAVRWDRRSSKVPAVGCQTLLSCWGLWTAWGAATC